MLQRRKWFVRHRVCRIELCVSNLMNVVGKSNTLRLLVCRRRCLHYIPPSPSFQEPMEVNVDVLERSSKGEMVFQTYRWKEVPMKLAQIIEDQDFRFGRLRRDLRVAAIRTEETVYIQHRSRPGRFTLK